MRPSRRSKSRTPAPVPHVDAFRPLAVGGLTALLVATPLIPAEAVAESSTGLFLILLWLLLLVAWAGAGIAAGKFTVRADASLIPVLALVVLVATSSAINAWNGNPRATINATWQWSAFGVAFFLMRQFLVSETERRVVVAAMIGLAAALAVLGFYQYFIANPHTRELFQRDPERVYLDTGLGPNPDPQMKALVRDRINSVEPMGTFALTNSLAGFLAPWLVLAAAIGLSLWRDREPFWKRAAAGVSLAALTVGGCLVLTKSRSAWVATAVGFGLVALFAGRGGRWRGGWLALAALGVAAALFLGAVLVGGIDAEVLSEAPKSLLYRLEYWQATGQMIREHPLWGIGVGNFQDYYTAYKLPQASETIADPHNFLLDIWANSGALAVVAWLAFLACVGWRWRRASLHVSPNPESRPIPSAPASEIATIYAAYVGALIGLLAAFPLSLAAGFHLDGVLLVLGAPVAAVCLALLHPWTRSGPLPVHLPALAALVMLVNFLGAGGIGFASEATSLWLLAALTLSAADQEKQVWVLGRAYGLGAVVLIVGLGAAFYFTAYRPSLLATAAMQRAEEFIEAGDTLQARRELQSAIAADPWAPAPRQDLASLDARDWLATDSAEALQSFEEGWPEAVRRNRRAFGLQKLLGDYYFDGYRRHGKREYLQASIEAYRRAVELYPAKASLRIELAFRLELSGDAGSAAEQAAEALRLDRQNPHEEQKLANFSVPPGAAARNLEHLAEILRKLNDSDESHLP